MEDLISSRTGSSMSEDDRQRSPSTKIVLRTFVIVMATAIATVLCILLFGWSTVSNDQKKMNKQPDAALRIDNIVSTVLDSAIEERPSVNHTAPDVEKLSVNDNFPKKATAVDQREAQGLSTSVRSRIPIQKVLDRRASHRLPVTNRQGDWNAAVDKWTTEQNGWTVYQDVYESGGSNAVDQGTVYQQPGNPLQVELTTEPVDYPPYGFWWPAQIYPVAGTERPTTDDQNRGRPPVTVAAVTDPKTAAATPQNNTVVVDWRAFGVVAFVNFVLFAVKTFAVVNSAMLLLFKVALAFLKFQLLVKAVKFAGSMAVSVPVLLATSLVSPMLVSSAMTIPERVLQLLTTPPPVAINSGPMPLGLPSNTMLPVRQPNRPPSSTTLPTDRLRHFSLPKLAADQFDLSDSPHEWHHELKQPSHGTAAVETVLRKLMDSEKCVERIACRMALAERVGIVPFWMRWIINGVSKVIPNEKLKSYFKTFDDVNNTIKTNMSISDNWITWCLEHYNCTDSILTTADDQKVNSTLSDSQDISLVKKEKQRLKLSKRAHTIKMNDKALRYLITKDNDGLSNNIMGKIPVLLIFPLIILIFLLVMIYL